MRSTTHARPTRSASPYPRRRLLLGRSAVALALVLAAGPGVAPAGAHLSIIRQGAESRGGIEAGDRHGAALAAGDFNGDTYDDLAMGAPLEDVGANADAGAVIVNFGARHGVTHVGSQLLIATSIGHTGQTGARFGAALAVGDFNADGFDDLVIGAPYENVGGVTDAGRVYIVYGSASGLQGNGIAWDQTTTGAANEAGDRFGSCFAVGNFNGDGAPYADLAIGAPGEDGGAGAVFVNYFGGPLGLTNGLATWVKQSSLGGANVAGDQFGFALAAGNLTGTSHDDLAIGAPFKQLSVTVPVVPGAGVAWVLRGSSNGITTSSPLVCDAATVGPAQSGANFGYALAVGQFFQGTYRSLAIGEPGRTVIGAANAGRVLVVEGGAALDWANARILTQGSGSEVAHANDRFGAVLAAGDFAVPDGYHDIGIGSPGDGFGVTTDAGQFQIFPGGATGPSGAGWSAFNQGTLNEPFEGGDEFGAAIAFGRFDEGSRGGFAVGAPGERYENPAEGPATRDDSGQVHMILPWRQTFAMHCLRSVVLDCENAMVFSQKPFERVLIASTTKAMTLLVAAERSQLPPGDPQYVDLDVFYFTPEWVAYEITGSQFGLYAGESMTIRNLLYACLYRSGNDAAYAIADACGKGATTDLRIADFVGAMNAKAAALGMLGTHFNNPPGFQSEAYGPELGEHYSTAYDMALLSRAVLENPLARQVSENISRDIVRILFYQGEYTIFPWTIMNFFPGMNLPNATGIKGGFTTPAQTTGLWSIEQPGIAGDVIATTFTTIEDSPQYTSDAAALMALGAAECSDGFVIGPWQRRPYRIMRTSLPTRSDSRWGASADVPSEVEGELVLDVFRQSGQEPAHAIVELRRSTEALFGPDQLVSLGVRPLHEHLGFHIQNMGEAPAVIRTRSSLAGSPVDWTIAPGETILVPAESEVGSPRPPAYQMVLANMDDTGVKANLVIQERYAFHLDGIPAAQAEPVFTAHLTRDGLLFGEGVDLLYSGRDGEGGPQGTAGSELTLALHEQGITVDVGDWWPAESDAPALRLLATSPNPFSDHTRIVFELARPARVDAAIFDLQGRPVYRFGGGELRPGRHEFRWGGTAASGARLANGLYFYRARIDGRAAAQAKIVLSR